MTELRSNYLSIAKVGRKEQLKQMILTLTILVTYISCWFQPQQNGVTDMLKNEK